MSTEVLNYGAHERKAILLDKLGGRQVLQDALDDFYNRQLDDPRLVSFFRGTDMEILKWHQFNLMGIAFAHVPDNVDLRHLLLVRHKKLFEEQGLSEARIRDIEAKLSNAQIIDIKSMPASDKVIFGTTVVLYDVETEEEVRYHIVGDDEADISSGKLSYSAPIARGIIGKREGDEIEVATPGGKKNYEIVEVLYI